VLNTKSKSEDARSQRQLAAAVGRSQSAIAQWIKDSRWPFSKRAPWNVEAVKVWVSSTLEKTPEDVGQAGSSALTKARTLKTLREIQRIEMQNDRLRGALVSLQDVRTEFNGVLGRFRIVLAQLPRQLVDALEMRGHIQSNDKFKVETLAKRKIEDAIELLGKALLEIADNGIPTSDNSSGG
jgi:hypothetical protein